MGRGKLSMKLIANEKSRKTTFHKRKKSLIRKAYELSTLCDVRACLFIYGPYQRDQSPAEVHTWPPSRNDLENMIASYKANCLHKRAKKVSDLYDFFSDRKKKIEADMSKLSKDVAESRFPRWDERLDYLLEDQLRLLMAELDSKLDAAKRRIELISENREGTSTSCQALSTTNLKQKQMMFEDQQNYALYENPSVETLEPIFPFHHHQLQTMPHNLQMESSVPFLPMDQKFENLSQYVFASNGSAQIQFNYGNFQNPSYSDPTNGMMMMESDQNYPAVPYYGAPIQSILPYMQLADDQMITYASNSQINTASAQANDHQFDYINYEYFMKTNNF